jgi:hypothetical protein
MERGGVRERTRERRSQGERGEGGWREGERLREEGGKGEGERTYHKRWKGKKQCK